MLAIVLSRRNFREYDQVIMVYTQEAGKCEFVAKGIKKMTSKNAAHLEPFSVVDIGTAVGKEYDYVTNVQSIYYFSIIRKNPARTHFASTLIQLLDLATKPGEADPELFSLTLETLQEIQDGNPTIHVVDTYALRLLRLLGFELDKTEAASHAAIHAALQYHLERKIPDWKSLG